MGKSFLLLLGFLLALFRINADNSLFVLTKPNPLISAASTSFSTYVVPASPPTSVESSLQAASPLQVVSHDNSHGSNGLTGYVHDIQLYIDLY